MLSRGIKYFHGKPHLPFPSGQYSVGCSDCISKNDNDEYVVFRIFYPSSKDTKKYSEEWPKWLPNREYSEGYLRFKLGNTARLPLMDRLFTWMVNDPFLPVVENAEIDGCKKWPLVFFSHGIGSCRTTYSRYHTKTRP